MLKPKKIMMFIYLKNLPFLFLLSGGEICIKNAGGSLNLSCCWQKTERHKYHFKADTCIPLVCIIFYHFSVNVLCVHSLHTKASSLEVLLLKPCQHLEFASMEQILAQGNLVETNPESDCLYSKTHLAVM